MLFGTRAPHRRTPHCESTADGRLLRRVLAHRSHFAGERDADPRTPIVAIAPAARLRNMVRRLSDGWEISSSVLTFSFFYPICICSKQYIICKKSSRIDSDECILTRSSKRNRGTFRPCMDVTPGTILGNDQPTHLRRQRPHPSLRQ